MLPWLRRVVSATGIEFFLLVRITRKLGKAWVLAGSGDQGLGVVWVEDRQLNYVDVGYGFRN